MDEKILIKSERCNLKKLFIIFLIAGIILGLAYASIYVVDSVSNNLRYYNICEGKYLEHNAAGDCGWDAYEKYGGKCGWCYEYSKITSKFSYAFEGYLISNFDKGLSVGIFVVVAVIGALIYFSLKNNELTVTDKRVYGIRAWGKRVDLPVDSVSATAKLKWGVAVATSSGTVRFRFLKNSQEIYDILNNLVIQRQKKENKVATPVASTTIIQSSDNADQLKKFKDLLDSGVISQEEFDAKKKQLLGL